jgi:hypothetical protein
MSQVNCHPDLVHPFDHLAAVFADARVRRFEGAIRY